MATALFYACGWGRHATVQFLLAQGADINVRDDNHGWTPLHGACDGRHLDIALSLLYRGADFNISTHVSHLQIF